MANENANDILQAIADDLMPEVGFSAILIEVQNDVWVDENDHTKGKETVKINHDVEVFVYDPEQKDIDGTLIQQNDKMVLVSIEDMTVTVTNTFLFNDGTNTWNIVKASPVPVGDTDATLILQVRR